ncbi:MAG: GIY-YIG nuclease family protein [Candidatus Liptonbacteria bacterium]|nr:GIY-YIG nuclease family protein [Candidatus Liptonbacteria bacterium]
MAWVYILQNGRDGRFYVGSTTDIGARLTHHFGGHTPSTMRLGNLAFVFSQEFPTLAKAREIERRLKRLKRKDYLEKIVRDGKIRMGA